MKIRITYTEAEREQAQTIRAALTRRLPGAHVKEADKHPPFKYIYFTVPPRKSP